MPRLYAVCLALLLLSVSVVAQSETLLWEVERTTEDELTSVRAIGLSRNTTIVLGQAKAADGSQELVAQAHNRATGAVLWTHRAPLVDAAHLATTPDRVFAAGSRADPAVPGGTDLVVRAVESATGTLLWSDVWDAGRDDFPHAS